MFELFLGVESRWQMVRIRRTYLALKQIEWVDLESRRTVVASQSVGRMMLQVEVVIELVGTVLGWRLERCSQTQTSFDRLVQVRRR